MPDSTEADTLTPSPEKPDRDAIRKEFDELLKRRFVWEMRFKIPGQDDPVGRAIVLPVPDRNKREKALKIVRGEESSYPLSDYFRGVDEYIIITDLGDVQIAYNQNPDLNEGDREAQPMQCDYDVMVLDRGDYFSAMQDRIYSHPYHTPSVSSRGAHLGSDSSGLVEVTRIALDFARQFPPEKTPSPEAKPRFGMIVSNAAVNMLFGRQPDTTGLPPPPPWTTK